MSAIGEVEIPEFIIETYSQKYYKLNREKILEYSKAYNMLHRERIFKRKFDNREELKITNSLSYQKRKLKNNLLRKIQSEAINDELKAIIASYYEKSRLEIAEKKSRLKHPLSPEESLGVIN